jgi:hypothetical protein
MGGIRVKLLLPVRSNTDKLRRLRVGGSSDKGRDHDSSNPTVWWNLQHSTSRQGALNFKYNSSLEFGFITASSHMPTISAQLGFKAKKHLNKLILVSKQDEVNLQVLRLSTNC